MASQTPAPSVPLYLFTFNCARTLITPSTVASHLFAALDPSSPPPEIVAIGLQEIAPISYSFLGGPYLTPYLDQWSSVPHLASQSLHSSNPKFPSEYVELGRHAIGMTALYIFSSRPEKVKNLQFTGVGFGVWGMANKGGVAARFTYSLQEPHSSSGQDDSIDIAIVSAHLSAHEHCCADRNRDWETLARGIVFETPTQTAPVVNITESTPLLAGNTATSSQISGIYHPNTYLFVMGDLNYRTSHTAPSPDDFRKFFPRSADEIPEFFKKDQLTSERLAGNTLHGFKEAPIGFGPTYKFLEDVSSAEDGGERGKSVDEQDMYVWAPNRWPSWCDRILWLPLSDSKLQEDVQVHRYNSIPAVRFSDHKPVGLHLSLPGIKSLKDVATGAAKDLRENPPFPLDRDWKINRYNAETREWIVGYAILMVTTFSGLAVVGCAVLGVGMLWWAISWR